MEYQIIYPDGLDEYDYFDISLKGWLEGVKVIWREMEIVLSIFDGQRLAQVVQDDISRLGYFALKSILVVRAVNPIEIEAAIERMAERDFVDVL